MDIFGINTGEFLILLVLAMVLIGPDKLPDYVARLREWITKARAMAEGAQSQLKEQMGPEFQDVDWKQYDPRQYDPRKIVRQALFDEPRRAELPADPDGVDDGAGPSPLDHDPGGVRYTTQFDPDRATPWDADAT